MESITLHWQGPFPLFKPETVESVTTNSAFVGKAGLYLWCFRHGKEYRVWYVGKSSDLSGRLAQHISSQLSGDYLVLDADVLQRDGQFKSLYTPNDIIRKLEFLKDFARLSNHAYRLLTLSEIFVATIESHLNKLDLVESAVIESLRQNPSSKPYIANLRISRVPNPDCPIELISQFESENVVVGVNQRIVY